MANSDPSISINLNSIIGRINPFILGQFIEHFPRQIYGGIYEEGSRYSDSDGFRLDVELALKNLAVPLLRWPGGNYTSGYHWKWGAGPKEERISRKNPHWEEFESHHFGTTEFVEYCRRIGAEPLICVGVGRSEENPTPEEAAAWVRYCNSTNGPEAELRAKAGYPEPLNVRWWGLGNECYGPWQIGYYQKAEDYGEDILKFIKAMKKADSAIKFVAVGTTLFINRKWNKRLLLNNDVAQKIDALSWHHYLQIGYSEERMEHTKATLALRKVEKNLDQVIKLIQDTHKRLGNNKLIQIAIDEWNEYGWEEVDIEKNALPEQYDLAHALYTAGFLNLIIRRAKNISMANYSPAVNTRGLIFADHRGILLRSSYYVYQMYKTCAGGFSISSKVESPKLGGSNALALDVASVKVNDNKIYLFVINRSLENLPCQVIIPDFYVKTSSGTIMTAENLRSYNSFKHPDTIKPGKFDVAVLGKDFSVTFPKHSISVLLLEN